MMTLIVIIILLLFGFRGYRNGLVKSLVSTFSLFITIFIAINLNPYISGFVENYTGTTEIITDACESFFTQNMDEDSAMNRAKNRTVSAIHEAMIDQLHLPVVIKDGLKKHNNVESYQALGVKNFYEYVPKYIANVIVKVVIFVVTWIASAVALYFLVRALKLVTELPGVKGLNRILGTLLGLLQGLVFVWFFFMIITMFGSFKFGAQLLGMISQSKFLGFLYDSNVILKTIQSVAHDFL